MKALLDMNICDDGVFDRIKSTAQRYLRNPRQRCYAILLLNTIRNHQLLIKEDCEYSTIHRTVEILVPLHDHPMELATYSDDIDPTMFQDLYARIARKGFKGALISLAIYVKDMDHELYERIIKILNEKEQNDQKGNIYHDDHENASIIEDNNCHDNSNASEDNGTSESNEITLRNLVNELKSSIKGQDDAVRELSLIAYEYIHYPQGLSNNVYLIGASGCGKTYMAERLAEACNLPILTLQCSTITEEGVKGENASDIIKKVSNFSMANKHGIILLDEFDKITMPNCDSGGNDRSRVVQFQIMQLLSGTSLSRGRNSRDYLIVMTGAYSNLRSETKNVYGSEIGFERNINALDKENAESNLSIEQLKRAGMTSELARRISNIIQINSLTKEAVLDIALSEHSMFVQKANGVKEAFNISLDVKEMSQKAIEQAFETADEDGLVNLTYSIYNKEVNKIVLDAVL